MTLSEFGRRAQENGSGTDHGNAGSHFVIGTKVKGGRYGQPTSLVEPRQPRQPPVRGRLPRRCTPPCSAGSTSIPSRSSGRASTPRRSSPDRYHSRSGVGRAGLEPARTTPKRTRWRAPVPWVAMFEHLAELVLELDELEARLPDIYASGDRAASRDAGRRHAELKPDRRRVRRLVAATGAVREASEMLDSESDPEMRDYLRAEIAEKEAAVGALEAELARAARAARPRRRQERDRRDPGRRGWRRGQPLGRRPAPHVRRLRAPPRLEGRDAVDPAVRHGRLPRGDRRGEGRRCVGPPEVRGRGPPRAAGARDREPGSHPHERGHGRRCCPRPRRSTSRSIPTTSRSTSTARAAPAGSRSTPPTPRCGSPTRRPAWWSRARTRRASSRTRRRRCASCVHGCCRSSASARRPSSSARRSQVKSGGRSDKIRTYNFKENRVTDHRVGVTLHALEQVLAGGEQLDEIVDALAADERRRQLGDDPS